MDNDIADHLNIVVDYLSNHSVPIDENVKDRINRKEELNIIINEILCILKF